MQAAIKRIQSRLKKLGIVKSSQKITVVYTAMLGQNENPTEQEITSVMEKLSENTDNQITPVTETVDITPVIEDSTIQVLELENNQPEEIKPAHSLTTVQESASESTHDKSNALVFVDPFSKALAIQQNIVNHEIQLTNAQVFELATEIPNEFSDQAELTKSILAFVHQKYDLDSLRSRLMVDESLEELRNKQQQFRLETSLKVKATFDIMHENAKQYQEADLKLLEALKESYRLRDEKRLSK
jgi:hypothetical protein